MLFATLVKTDFIMSRQGYRASVKFFEWCTLRGGRRYRADVTIGDPDDRVMFDCDSLSVLETRVASSLDGILASRALMAAQAAAPHVWTRRI